VIKELNFSQQTLIWHESFPYSPVTAGSHWGLPRLFSADIACDLLDKSDDGLRLRILEPPRRLRVYVHVLPLAMHYFMVI
jgi:hypothetical protein